MSSGNTQLTEFDPQQLAAIDATAQECAIAVREAGNSITGALALADGMRRLRAMITAPMLGALAALQNTALGFRTDRGNAKTGPKEYAPDELRDVMIEAAARGFRPVNNEFNVIAGRFYGAKSGFERLVRTFPGLTEFSAAYDVEETSGGFARVQCVATWLLDGEPGEFCRRKENIKGKPFDNRIRVRVNEGMGYDALIGKSQRKFYAAIYDYLINAESATPEGDPDDTVADPDAGKRVRRTSIFDARSEAEETGPSESGQAQLVAAYRGRLASIQAKTEVSPVARDAGKDGALTPQSRAAIMGLCSEAMKLWPDRIPATSPETRTNPEAAPQAEQEPPSNPPTVSEMLAWYQGEATHCKTLIDFGRLRNAATEDAALGDEDRVAVLAMIKTAEDAIRTARGPRTNAR